MATEPIVRTEGVRHESRDTNLPSLALFGGAIVVTVAIVMLFCLWLFGIYTRVQSLGPAAKPFASSRPLPPEPRLQPKPENDLQNYLEDQHTELNTYGWVDRSTGIVRIPIERAMQLLLQQGLPVRNSSQSARLDANRTLKEATNNR
ncbi:MAG: hypothetical protein WBD87_09260 [Candidatus Acidiferrales bacterium]